MEYQYITQDVIDEGTINVTSAQIHAEAEDYNDRMRKCARQKKVLDICFPNWCVAQFALLAYCMFYVQIEYEESPWLPLRMFACLPYIVLFLYFIVYKKKRTPLAALLVSLPLPVAALKLTVMLIANVVLAHFYTKQMDKLTAHPGFPAFSLLRITYRTEYDNAER